MERDTDPFDKIERVTIDRAELRRRIANMYEKQGKPLPEKWVLQIDLGGLYVNATNEEPKNGKT